MTNDQNKNDHIFSYNRPTSLFMYPSLQNSIVYSFPTSRTSSAASYYHQLSNPFSQQYTNSSSPAATATVTAPSTTSSSSSAAPSSASSLVPNFYNANNPNNLNVNNTISTGSHIYVDVNNYGQQTQYNYFPYESTTASMVDSTRLNPAGVSDSVKSGISLKNTDSPRLPSILSSTSPSLLSSSSGSNSSPSSFTAISSRHSSLLSTNSVFKQAFLRSKAKEQTELLGEPAPVSPKTEEVRNEHSHINSAEYSRCRRKRKKAFEVERHYRCNYQFCNKAYGTLNHLNTHILIQKHGKKRLPQEFSQLRKQLRKERRESLKAMRSQSTFNSKTEESPFSSSASSLMANSASPAPLTPATMAGADSETPNSFSLSSSSTYVSPEMSNNVPFNYGYKNIGYNTGPTNDDDFYNGGGNYTNGNNYTQYYEPYERNPAIYQPKYLGYSGLNTQRYGKDGNSFLQQPNYLATAPTTAPGGASGSGSSNYCIISHKNSGNFEAGFSNANFYCDKLD
ncbi:hypothetical protein PICMEDRAFT_12886 [Pichia membranifaciens NRRL Y-2026]|uniref:C2H2-type domain-containing protein n=1 Tax=Pichia membranifaciens NRRL Y-2026 TaxID=763406 RepID=A0A1E3NG87_9ASCO|nr:hypothetical protein PICMEDRAFT_12886 [Pichia membranifaciens NRRL Y-2026]ODQ45151.1 hypothetical protein PICMEDRAFT_12886 [Pichia membranifaciens NRRL Y-2026]